MEPAGHREDIFDAFAFTEKRDAEKLRVQLRDAKQGPGNGVTFAILRKARKKRVSEQKNRISQISPDAMLGDIRQKAVGNTSVLESVVGHAPLKHGARAVIRRQSRVAGPELCHGPLRLQQDD